MRRFVFRGSCRDQGGGDCVPCRRRGLALCWGCGVGVPCGPWKRPPRVSAWASGRRREFLTAVPGLVSGGEALRLFSRVLTFCCLYCFLLLRPAAEVVLGAVGWVPLGFGAVTLQPGLKEKHEARPRDAAVPPACLTLAGVQGAWGSVPWGPDLWWGRHRHQQPLRWQ